MSPERRKYKLPGQLRQLSERRPGATLPSWDNTWKTIDLRTRNHPAERRLVREGRTAIREFYDARYAIATGNGRGKLDAFIDRYTVDKSSEVYNPDLIDKLSPYLSIIRDSFPSSARR